MSKNIWFSFFLCHLFLFDGTLSASFARLHTETETPETTSAPTTNATVKQTSFPETTTTQLPATGEIQAGKHGNLELPVIPRVMLEKPLPKKRGIVDSLYQPGSFDETGYDANEDAGPDEGFSTSKSDFEEKPFYKYSDAAFVADDGYFENEGRTKRTVDTDVPDIRLTVDEFAGLLDYLESRYDEEQREKAALDADNNIGSIQADMREARMRDPGRYDRMIASYLSRVKGISFDRPTGSSVYEHQRSYTPSYRRQIL